MRILKYCLALVLVTFCIRANAQNIAANFSATTVCFNNQTCFTDLSTSTNGPRIIWSWDFGETRQLCGEEIFLGKRQSIDRAYIKANASLDSLQEKEVLDEVEKYSDELNDGSEYKITEEKKETNHQDKSNPTVTSEKKTQIELHHKWKEEAYKEQPGHNRKEDADSRRDRHTFSV